MQHTTSVLALIGFYVCGKFSWNFRVYHKVMGLIKEPKHIDFSTKSEPWTEQELSDFRKLMQEIKREHERKRLRKIVFKERAVLS